MKPFDLTQAAYALETVASDLRVLDETKQRLVVMMGPGAVHLLAAARRFHDAVLILAAHAEVVERLAQHEEAIFTLLAALERGEDVRLICTPVSSPAEPAAVVRLDSEAA